MKELVLLLNQASEAYYQWDRPILSDHEYDRLYDELKTLEETTGILLANSPTQAVGFTVLSNLTKVKHESKMLSLDKTKEIEELVDWLGDQTGLLSWKLDGLTIVLRYQSGVLMQALTRGNGAVGEDITHNVKVFQNVPLKIPFLGELVLRGEGVISYKEFERINALLPDEEKYKNPRNLCSGTVRQLNSEICSQRNVRFLAFTLVEAEGKEFKDSKCDQLNWLTELGFETVYGELTTQDTIELQVKQFERKIEKNDYPSDGLVLTFDSIEYSKTLGQTTKFPRDSIAFKWQDEMAETTLVDIEWNTSRTGLMNPIAVFKPVDLEGSTISRASIHNISIAEELKLGKGDHILIYKANMIIPQIAENKTKSGPMEIPKHCFVCGGETEVQEVRKTKMLYCSNPNCQAQVVQAMTHFVSRDAMNIQGLSEATIQKFVDLGYLKFYPDIFHLKEHREIQDLKGFKEKSFDNLTEAIEECKAVHLENFIYALGIRHVGLSNAKILCQEYDFNLEKILSATENELNEIDGFGEIISHSVCRYFSDQGNRNLLEQTVPLLEWITPEKMDYLPLKGVTFVITGEVNHFENRKILQAKLESLGGKVTGSVSKKTSYLVNNDLQSASSKNKKALELGIPILNEEMLIAQFLQRY